MTSNLSEKEALDKCKGHAERIMNICKQSPDGPAKAFLTLRPLTEIHPIHLVLFNNRQSRKAVIKKLISMKFLDLLVDAAVYCADWPTMPDNVNPNAAVILVYAVICTMTDASPEACRVFMKRDLITQLMKNIASEENRTNSSRDTFVSLNMSSIHNMAKLPECRPSFDALNAVETIKFFFSWQDEKLQISALSAVACLVSDSKESEALLDDQEIIPKLVNCLRKAIENEDGDKEHVYLGFSAEELVESLAFLAVNDENKLKIAESGALPLLAQMLGSECDEVEQGRAVDCLWALAFKDNLRKDIIDLPDCLSNLESIARMARDSNLKIKAGRALDFIKVGQDGLAKGDSTKKDVHSASKTKDNGHIFISYNWKHQDVVLKIRQLLLDAGFKVWMDVDNMHNNTLEAMALGVENAFLVIICYSEYYKQSNMCRTEAEYVFRLNKPFIPVNMEYRYQPTGWLGIIIGARLYVDFSLFKHPLEKVTERLMNEINQLMAAIGKDAQQGSQAGHVEVPIIASQAQNQTGFSEGSVPKSRGENQGESPCKCCKLMEKLVSQLISAGSVQFAIKRDAETSIRQWDKTKVVSWLRDEGLSHVQLSDFDGQTLLGLFGMKLNASQVYYSSVLKMTNNSFPDCIRFTAALDKLLNE